MLFSKKSFVNNRLTVVLLLLTFLTALPLHSVRASVGLIYFRAVPGTDFIRLEWETAQELNNLGFQLFRGLTGDFDDAQQINSGVIPAQGGATGAFYEWVDNNVQAGIQYTYWLKDIDTSGYETLHDPVTASTTGGNTFPTVPSPGGNNTATPTPTRTPTPTPTVQSGSTSAPTQTPTRIPTAQPTSSNPTSTTAPQTQPTAASNNVTIQQPAATSQSAATAASEPESEETTQTVSNNSVSTPAGTAASSTGPETTATPQSLVQAASASDQGNSDAADGLTAQQIGQGGEESQETGTVNPNSNTDDSSRSTLVVMALVISVVLLLAGGGGIIMLLLNRTKQTRI